MTAPISYIQGLDLEEIERVLDCPMTNVTLTGPDNSSITYGIIKKETTCDGTVYTLIQVLSALPYTTRIRTDSHFHPLDDTEIPKDAHPSHITYSDETSEGTICVNLDELEVHSDRTLPVKTQRELFYHFGLRYIPETDKQILAKILDDFYKKSPS